MRPADGTAHGFGHKKAQEPSDAENKKGNEKSGVGRTTGPRKTFADSIYQSDDCEEDEITAARPNRIDCGRGELRASLTREEQLRFLLQILFGHNDAALRKVLKACGPRVSGEKPESIPRVYLVFRGYILSGSNAADIFAQKRGENGHAEGRSGGNSFFKDFRRWIQVTRGTHHTLKDVPADAVLMRNFTQAEIDHFMENEALVEAERKMVRDGEDRPPNRVLLGVESVTIPRHGEIAKYRSPNDEGTGGQFTLSHFARPCIILRDDEEARLAHIGTGQPLTQHQQENRVSRDACWDTVAYRLNEMLLKPRIYLRGIIEDVNPAIPPYVPTPGSKWKAVWYDMRGQFTVALRNFDKSGQSDPTLNGFLPFTLPEQNGELHPISKRLVTLFVVMRISKDIPGDECTNMRSLTVKTIPHRDVFDAKGTVVVWDKAKWAKIIADKGGDYVNARKKRKKDSVSADTQFLTTTVRQSLDRIADNANSANFNAINVNDNQSLATSRGKLLYSMKEEMEAVYLLHKSYDQMMNAEKRSEGFSTPFMRGRKDRYRRFNNAFIADLVVTREAIHIDRRNKSLQNATLKTFIAFQMSHHCPPLSS